MPSFKDLLAVALAHPPDPYEPLPLINRKETIMGTTLSFLILSWMAVLSRLWVRLRVVKDPGYDDIFVVAAALTNTIATICVCLSIDAGFGHHMLYLSSHNLQRYRLLFYIENGTYNTETVLIKISLLLQYLRIFKAGRMRWTCIVLIVLVSAWGLAMMVVTWFPCWPVRGYWLDHLHAKCYGYGLADVGGFVSLFIVHAAVNMVFDAAIFLAPMILFRTPDLKSKNLLAMAGVFIFGGVVVALSIWRLSHIIISRAATYPYLDFTWRSPLAIVLACLEVNLAIICASMPIFWPIVEQSFSSIFVKFEVQMVEERVSDDYGLAYELEHRITSDPSLKSSGTSTHELTDQRNEERGLSNDYPHGCDQLSEVSKTQGLTTEIQSLPKPRWEL